MKLNVLYFAHVRERVGIDGQQLQLPDGKTVREAWGLLCEEHPALVGLERSVRFALDGHFVPPDTVLEDGQELVMIPPVSGGSDLAPVGLTHEPLSADRVQELEALVMSASSGALVTFQGVVRDHARGRSVTALDYEAYEPMARRIMEGIAREVEKDSPGVKVALWHRVGSLEVGDVAVVVIAASPHRAQAFLACQRVIDRLKEDVPIWKREIGPDGEDWVTDRP